MKLYKRRHRSLEMSGCGCESDASAERVAEPGDGWRLEIEALPGNRTLRSYAAYSDAAKADIRPGLKGGSGVA